MVAPEKQLELDAENFIKKQNIDLKFRKFGNYNHGKYKNKKGTFDWLCSFRNKLFWIEWKVGNNKLSPDQEEFQKWILQNNGLAFVCYSLEDFYNTIKKL